MLLTLFNLATIISILKKIKYKCNKQEKYYKNSKKIINIYADYIADNIWS